MATLSNQQYNFIQRIQREEEFQTKRTEKIKVLGIYLDQADTILSLLARSSAAVFSNPEDAIRRFAEIDLIIDTFNPRISNAIEDGEDSILELTADQTVELLSRAQYAFTFGAEFVTNTKNLIDDTRKYRDGQFTLSDAIWGKDKRDQFYKGILDDINAGRDRQEITNKLEDSLLKKGNGGQFYNVERVLDTEYNRAYNLGKIEATRGWNNDPDIQDELGYVRELSSAHKVKDICDELAGFYRTKGEVPANPHPNDLCITRQMFLSDWTGKIKVLKFSKGIYKSKEFKNQQTFMV